MSSTLLLCHGKSHHRKMPIKEWSNDQIDWECATYVDIREECNPTLALNITKDQTVAITAIFDHIYMMAALQPIYFEKSGRLCEPYWNNIKQWLAPGGILHGYISFRNLVMCTPDRGLKSTLMDEINDIYDKNIAEVCEQIGSGYITPKDIIARLRNSRGTPPGQLDTTAISDKKLTAYIAKNENYILAILDDYNSMFFDLAVYITEQLKTDIQGLTGCKFTYGKVSDEDQMWFNVTNDV